MCGIAGIMMRDAGRVDSVILDHLAAALAHRGPDGSGRFIAQTMGLVQTRLAIVDLAGGAQPFYDGNGNVLVANGEIYNDPELRGELSRAIFVTGSDCEVPLHLYQRHGLRFAEYLRGMYAIALYDPFNSRLVLSRDPFGIKPLYFVETPECFAFASEPRALLAAGLARRSVSSRQRAELMQLKFTTGSATIFHSIQRVLPGETLAITDGAITWRSRRRALLDSNCPVISYGAALQQLDEVLADSVLHHLRSDVPYGLFLSSGVDSAALISLMARFSARPIMAFTASFPGEAEDEREGAQRIARFVGAQHQVVEVTERDFWCEAPQLAAALDDPTTDAATLPTYVLAKAAKNDVKVVLTGEGGDEMFCGYSRYHRARRLWGVFARKARRRGEFDQISHVNQAFNGWRGGLALTERQETNARRTFVQTLQAIDCAEWLPNDLLIKVDRCLMAHGVEGRTPFLDPIVADFSFRLPDWMKATTNISKRLLRDWLAANLAVAEPYNRKTGFNPPIGRWIASRQALIQQLIATHPAICGIFPKALVTSAFSNLKKRPQAAWSLLLYALWHSHHVLEVPADGTIEDVLVAAAKAA